MPLPKGGGLNENKGGTGGKKRGKGKGERKRGKGKERGKGKRKKRTKERGNNRRVKCRVYFALGKELKKAKISDKKGEEGTKQNKRPRVEGFHVCGEK